MRIFVRALFFASGAAGLVFEIVWLRYLGLAIGATSVAVATTTAAYMGGLALGSHIAGRKADRQQRPLMVYGMLEVTVALIGALIPLVCRTIPAFDERFLAGVASGSSRSLIRFIVAIAILIAPTTVMGMTLPMLSRVVVNRLGSVGREIGMLYAVNLGGAVLGAALSGFILIPNLGVSTTNFVAVGLDVLLGTSAIVVGLMTAKVPVAPNIDDASSTVLRPGARVVIALLIITGAAAMALQILWTRGLGTALGPSTYAFTAIVCAYLVGLGGGSAIASRLADRVRSIRLALAITLLITATTAWLGIIFVDDLPMLLRPIVLDPRVTVSSLVRTDFILAALSLLPATAAMGAIFPLTVTAVAGDETRIGAAVGRAYALNTLGNILGSFAAVFVLLPIWGVEWGMRVATLSYVFAALVLAFMLGPEHKRRWRPALIGMSAVITLALLLWPSWDIGRWTLGMFRPSMVRSFFTDSDVHTHVIFHADGLASTVTVEEESGMRWIKVNGKIDGSSQGDMPTQILSGLLPMLIHPAPKQVAVIGCGTCVTAGATLRANPDHVTLIELEPEVVRAAHLFTDVNHEPWNDPRFSVVEDDGRNYMMRPGPQFDVIVSEPSNPWMTGAAGLFTLEFFRTAQKRLAPGGMFLQWLQAYELAPERIASVLKTFNTVFPHVIVFSAHPDSNDLLLLGSGEPLTLPRARLLARFNELGPELARAEIHKIEDLLALVLLTDKELAQLPSTTELNTDDNALVEFGAPKDLVAFAEDDPVVPIFGNYTGKRAAMVRRLGGISNSDQDTLALVWGYLQRGMLNEALATAKTLTERPTGSTAVQHNVAISALEASELAKLLLSNEDDEPIVVADASDQSQAYRDASQFLAGGHIDKALARFEQSPAQTTIERVLYAYLLYKQERYADARRYWLTALHDSSVARFYGAINYYLARASYYDAAYGRAVIEMQRYRQLKIDPLATSRQDD